MEQVEAKVMVPAERLAEFYALVGRWLAGEATLSLLRQFAPGVLDGVFDDRLVVAVGRGQHLGCDRRRREVQVVVADGVPVVGQRGRIVPVHALGSVGHPREKRPHVVEIHPAVVGRQPVEVPARALGQPLRARPVLVRGVIDDGGELDEPVEQALVVAVCEVEPLLLPGVVGGVVPAGVVDGDAGPEVGVHAIQFVLRTEKLPHRSQTDSAPCSGLEPLPASTVLVSVERNKQLWQL